ncbi:MAG: outer-membrane lipoprotein carrier protein LolA [Bryobacteraceae bacterium]|nr:outer-membrane lipoprotein carrier protein LolA [Bryobacteraceae bacterium]
MNVSPDMNHLHRAALAVVFLSAPGFAQDGLTEVLARMDKVAPGFESMAAKFKWTEYTSVIKETNESSGEIRFKRIKNKVRGLIDYTQPDAKTVMLADQQVWIHLPKIKTAQIYDLGKQGDQLYQFLLLGFGTSSASLRKNWDVKLAGSDTVAGHKTSRLELIPKSGEARNYLSRVELWIPENGSYPLQEKLHQKSGDYILISYSAQQFNTGMPDGSLDLKLPPGTKKEYPQK